jgi:hypothetical protein
MSATTETHPLDNPDVSALLDILFADREPGAEPDWAAIKTKIFLAQGPLQILALDLLRALWLVYEDEAAAMTALWVRVVREP